MAPDNVAGNYGFMVDRGEPTGNSPSTVDGRYRTHVKVSNDPSEGIPVFVTSPPLPPQSEVLDYQFVTAVPSGILTTVYTYTVASAKTLYIQRISLSGDTVSQFDFSIDAAQKGRKRLYWTDVNPVFELMADTDDKGIQVNAGSTVLVTVIHQRPNVGEFEVTLQGVLVG